MTEPKPIGYTVGLRYPEGTDYYIPRPSPVFELTAEQKELKARFESNKANLLRLTKELGDLISEMKSLKCPHQVFNDTDHTPWYHRNCLICGAHIDTF